MIRAFGQAVTDAEVNEAATFHWLRHTHGSQLVAAGWDIAAVAARLGDTIATVQQTYLHEFDAVRREQAQRDALAAMAARWQREAVPSGLCARSPVTLTPRRRAKRARLSPPTS